MALFSKKKSSGITLPEQLPQHVGFIMDGNVVCPVRSVTERVLRISRKSSATARISD
jgi:undecaprenyl pyrophosphate synthase